ncbi:Nicotinamidase-related amidase [Dethiosulfatibacter aminovorans DSM 17477]|uniref:Nicotinamidase-related amidase n=1 Tax=Dethiosulfatibacter aminovorans DSM 17477 TaxID=1121476 RepID=A0A1M6A816_9FIRM|nr:isochorismatase family cysteine hydrolase [Dethiosulfatibacter aminovorans]SHI32566.1 Nicotinamidase-related amidase [Dethiosulfatibacter aminovorans DSM 17477]
MSKYAVIVIDVLNEFITGAVSRDTSKSVINPIARLTEEARKKDVPVIYANDTHIVGEDKELEIWGDHAIAGTKEAEVVDELAPQDGDYVVNKRSYSAFYKTNLDLLLRELGVDTLIITGLYLHISGRQTCVDGFNLDYQLIVPRESTATFPEIDFEQSLRMLKDTLGVKICSVDEAIELL